MATFKDLFEKQAKQALDESFKYTFAKGKEEEARKKYEESRTKAQQALGDVAKAYSEGKATFKAAASDGFGFTATFNQVNNDIEGAFGSVEDNFKKGADMMSSGMADMSGAFKSFGDNFKKAQFKQLEKSIVALRSGKVVIRSGQSIIISEITSSNKEDIRNQIEKILIKANKYTHKIVKPKSKEITNILLLRKNHIDYLQNTILKGGNWVINIKSVRNVLSGENFVYAFPEITFGW